MRVVFDHCSLFTKTLKLVLPIENDGAVQVIVLALMITALTSDAPN